MFPSTVVLCVAERLFNSQRIFKSLILMTAISGKPKAEICQALWFELLV